MSATKGLTQAAQDARDAAGVRTRSGATCAYERRSAGVTRDDTWAENEARNGCAGGGGVGVGGGGVAVAVPEREGTAAAAHAAATPSLVPPTMCQKRVFAATVAGVSVGRTRRAGSGVAGAGLAGVVKAESTVKPEDPGAVTAAAACATPAYRATTKLSLGVAAMRDRAVSRMSRSVVCVVCPWVVVWPDHTEPAPVTCTARTRKATMRAANSGNVDPGTRSDTNWGAGGASAGFEAVAVEEEVEDEDEEDEKSVDTEEDEDVEGRREEEKAEKREKDFSASGAIMEVAVSGRRVSRGGWPAGEGKRGVRGYGCGRGEEG
ncbi:hypothetical protein HDU93_007490 [Gonapodya sp. JEL0774]|nr:hypothetical protein HDU93_007490 [Gonapodya sp. JEL0774]